MKTKTPCIGICSTTSLGDRICRGCKRYAPEVIDWNSYSEREKQAVLARLEKLSLPIMQRYFEIQSVEALQEGLRTLSVPYNGDLSAYCWLHNLLKKRHRQLSSLESCGVSIRAEYAHQPLHVLAEEADRELLTLAQAHYERYLEPSH